MRFSELTLERYGRFEDCRLKFRDGAPDLHVIYGANEAGKSTTLAAVSDLLFGFGQRTPYNFRFDYNLLRVGAVIEGDGGRHAFRRRKANSGSLVDAADRPMDEGVLLAMLKGQTRETFRLAFSLDHLRLREGGRAIVDAKDDLGRAVFAAGSGMTGVSAALTTLEEEINSIWGPRASAKRTYSAAKSAFDESTKLFRVQEVKPKAWSDARKALDEHSRQLEALEQHRQALSNEQRRVDRLRRINPAARRREELLSDLETKASVTALSPQAETAVEAALATAAEEDRKRAAAESLLHEAETQASTLTPDDAVLALAERIEAAVKEIGAEQARIEQFPRRLETIRSNEAGITELERELGIKEAGENLPSRLAVEDLRSLMETHTATSSRLVELRQSLRDLEARASPLRERLADAVLDESLPALAASVDAARALGTDIDARCEEQARAAWRADSEAQTALARLAPWSGTLALLAAVREIGEPEIDAARAALFTMTEAQGAETAAIARAEDELARLSLERETLAAGGQAVSIEALGEARATRDDRWRGVRAHVLGEESLKNPQLAAAEYEGSVAEADAVADRRFVLAEASGLLGALDARRAALELDKELARRRREKALVAHAEALAAWSARVVLAGLPDLEPLPLRAWLSARGEALTKATAAETAREQAETGRQRRAEARARLAALLDPVPGDGETLAPMLEHAEQRWRAGQDRADAFKANKAALRTVEDDMAVQRRKIGEAEASVTDTSTAWAKATVGLDLRIDAAGARLAALDELRQLRNTTRDLERRVAEMRRDADAFAADVTELADGLAVAPDEPRRQLETLQARLTSARATAEALRQLKANTGSRRDERDRAAATRDAALASLGPVLAQIGRSDPADLPEAIGASRDLRALREALADSERAIAAGGDGYALLDLVDAWRGEDPDQLAARADTLRRDLDALNAQITEASKRLGEASRAFEALEGGPRAADALADAQLAKAEMEAQAESYLLKRTQAVMLRWAIERYRERRQNPLLTRAGQLFAVLTLGRYVELRVDMEAASPRLLGLAADRASLIDVESMSEGTVDQLFLALRLAAVEQSIASGVRLPFLADDLFVNFDDDRARAGFRVLAELARSTQVLFFTHHAHLAPLARDAVDADTLSECTLD